MTPDVSSRGVPVPDVDEFPLQEPPQHDRGRGSTARLCSTTPSARESRLQRQTAGTLGSTECLAASRLHKAKGRERRVDYLSPELQAQFVEARKNNQRNWLDHGVVELLTKEQQETLPTDRVLILCRLEVDKNKAIRRGKSYEEPPLRAKPRLVAHGFKDPDAFAGTIKTDVPTSPAEAIAILVHLATSMRWHLHHGDVESVFLGRRVIKFPKATGG